MTLPVSQNAKVYATDYGSLATQINTELTRRGGGYFLPTDYSGKITAADYNRMKTTLSTANTYPFSTGLPDVTIGTLVSASTFNNLLSAINEAQTHIFTTQGAANTLTLNNAYFSNLGWNGTSKLVANVNITGTIGSNSISNYSLTLTGSYPNGSIINIINHSGNYIVGAGGTGGIATDSGFNWGGGTSGSNGGPALFITGGTGATWNITNYGTIAGGGGGGGAGHGIRAHTGDGGFYGGAGGGGAGYNNGLGGEGNSNVSYAGTNGTLTTGGAGGGEWADGNGNEGAAGNNGGDLGQPGTSFGNTNVSGIAGAAITGSSNASWVVNGTIIGTIN